jgi:hypothetical protein
MWNERSQIGKLILCDSTSTEFKNRQHSNVKEVREELTGRGPAV